MVNGMPVEGMVRKVVTSQTPLSRHKGGLSPSTRGQSGAEVQCRGEVLTLGATRHPGLTLRYYCC